MKKNYQVLFAAACLGVLSAPFSYAEEKSKADSLFLAGKYYPAAVEYERDAYLSGNNALRTRALIKKAECCKQLENYPEAVKTTERIIYTALTDTLVAEARYQGALCCYLSGDFAAAENYLIQLHFFVKDSTLTRGSLQLYALVLNELRKWDEAKQKLLTAIDLAEISGTEKDSLRKSVAALYLPKNYPRLKNLRKAQKMSSLLPGLGQLYAGYFWEGAASAFLNVASLGLTGYFIYTRLYITAAGVGSGMFSKFYLGGMNRLEYLVAKKNYEKLRRYNNDLKLLVMKAGK